MKQKAWWKEHAPDEMYKYDYIAALSAHAFSWAFMIQLPILIYMRFTVDWLYFALFGMNVVLHAMVDNLKADEREINLIVDQLCHLVQIVGTILIVFPNYIEF